LTNSAEFGTIVQHHIDIIIFYHATDVKEITELFDAVRDGMEDIIMCVIAGYIGSRPAAPILIEMLSKQEGIGGGYFTGIATVHEGKLHYAKLTGDLARLEALTEAASLPGTVGIIHSRTNSGGGDEWAHPFIGMDGDEPVLAYVANGAACCFKNRTEEYNHEAEKMLVEGYRMLSRVEKANRTYNRLSDGTSIHMSDLMCQFILREVRSGLPLDAAMGQAFSTYPSEIVGLSISRDTPDAIGWARINFPMTAAFAPHGAYLASIPLAMPSDAAEPMILPVNSSGLATADSLTVHPFKTPPAKIAALDSHVRAAIYTKVEAILTEGEYSYPEVRKVIDQAHIFAEAECQQTSLAVYEALSALIKTGRLEMREIRVPGAADGLDAPRIMMRLK